MKHGVQDVPSYKLKANIGAIILISILLLRSDSLWLEWVLNCKDWAVLEQKKLHLQNNIWGKNAEDQHTQCIAQHPEKLGSFRWLWDWETETFGVKAYPSILYGHKPWAKHSTSSSLPKRLTELSHAVVDFKIDTKANGRANILLEAWLTDDADPQAYDRTSELAIHLMQQNWPGQGGEYVETITISGYTFNVYLNHEMKVPRDPHTWSYLSFVKQGTPLLHGSLDLRLFIDYLLRKRFIVDSEYLVSIELGNEIDQGAGQTEVDYFHVNIE